MVHPATGQRDTARADGWWMPVGLRRRDGSCRADWSQCRDNATVATTEVAGEVCQWPRGMWLGQRQLLVLPEQVLNPPQGSPSGGLLATPTFVVFLRGFYWHLCLCIPMIHPAACTRCCWGSTGPPDLAGLPWGLSTSTSHPLPGKDLAPELGRCHHRHRRRPLGHDSLQNKKQQQKKNT